MGKKKDKKLKKKGLLSKPLIKSAPIPDVVAVDPLPAPATEPKPSGSWWKQRLDDEIVYDAMSAKGTFAKVDHATAAIVKQIEETPPSAVILKVNNQQFILHQNGKLVEPIYSGSPVGTDRDTPEERIRVAFKESELIREFKDTQLALEAGLIEVNEPDGGQKKSGFIEVDLEDVRAKLYQATRSGAFVYGFEEFSHITSDNAKKKNWTEADLPELRAEIAKDEEVAQELWPVWF